MPENDTGVGRALPRPLTPAPSFASIPKTEQDAAMTLPPESHRPSAGRSYIAPDVEITGDIGSDGTVEIQGRVQGKITARTLVLGPEGQVNGTIAAETVDLRGKVDGKISGAALTLRSTAQVQADSSYQTLAIENGARVEGRFTRAKG